MKKLFIVCLTGLLFLTACENSGSSSVGTYEKDETTQSTDKKESESTTDESKTKVTTTDTLKTTTNPGVDKMNSTSSADSLK